MTREEIKYVASKLADTNIGPYNEYDYTDHSRHNTYRCAYEEGIIAAFKYVDEHLKNPWRDTKKELPKGGEK